jgi:polyisoprenoid-binding protein YceI
MPRAIHRAVTLLTFVLAASAAGQAGFTTSAAPPRSIAHGNATAVWRIDPARSEVRFTVTKLGFEDVTGVFRESDGQFRYTASDPTASSIQWRVRVSSVLTDASNRDRTLQSPEYFDASRHPYLTFESRTIQVRPDGSLNVSGDITIRGVTRGITVHVRPRSSADGLVFETDFELDRYD